jgi:hypothetical protein
MDKLSEEVARGAEAERILTNPLYIESFDKVEKGLIDTLLTSPLGDDKTHNRLAIALQVLHQTRNALKTIMETGKLAKIQVNEPTVVDKVRNFARPR